MGESLEQILLADKRIAQQPILLPDHPIVASLKDFGVDELYAAGVDIVATGLAGTFITGPVRMAVLPFIGPVLEKGVFFARHAYDAHKIYKTTPEIIRQSRTFYFKEGIKHGSANLVKDVTIHDPIYSGGVAAGLYMLPDVHPLFLSMMSYVIGVAVVAGIDVTNNARKFNKIQRELTNKGFVHETYWESRFLISSEKSQHQVMDLLSKEFGLTERGSATFHDVYMQNTLSVLNGRTGKLRLRTRGRRDHEKGEMRWGSDPDSIHTLQIIYSRARSNSRKKELEQFNYFPIEKTKLCYMLDEPAFNMESLPQIPRSVAERYSAPEPHYRSIVFERTLCNSEQLAVCTDEVKMDRPYYVLELKVFKDTDLLQKAMRYVMLECPVVSLQTTQGKGDLFI